MNVSQNRTYRTQGCALEPLEDRSLLSGLPLPRPEHVVVVIEENHSYGSIIGSNAAPYINSLAAGGALFTQSFALTHPSQPNYIALFSGSAQGVVDDSGPNTFSAPNLGGELIASGRTFAGYSENLPYAGYTGLKSNGYSRKHNPWSDFSDIPASANQPLTSFPADYSKLPTVSFVVPTKDNNMHDGSIQTGDAWLHDHLDGYAKWARTHNSLLIVTWDEDDKSSSNQIPTFFVGQGVQPGRFAEPITHYSVLRTLEDMYGLGHAARTTRVAPITDVWAAAPAGPDTTPPTATLMTALRVRTVGGTFYKFVIRYYDRTSVDLATVDSSDVIVTGPGGFSSAVRLLSKTVVSSRAVDAFYRLAARGGAWDRGDNGLYTITQVAGQVADPAGNSAPAVDIGQFTVRIAKGAVAKPAAVPALAAGTFSNMRVLDDHNDFAVWT